MVFPSAPQPLSPSAPKTVIFDLDDTLVETAPLYTRALDSLVECLRTALPAPEPRERVLAVQEDFDRRAMTDDRFDVRRFPGSFAATYRHFCVEQGAPVDPLVEDRCRAFGNTVHTEAPELMPRAIETLEWLRPHADLWLYTLGEESIQLAKVRRHGLERHFASVNVVSSKHVSTLRALVAGHNGRRFAMVGDSLRLDVNPALELGLFAVLLRRQVPWSYSEVPPVNDSFRRAADLGEARAILEREFLAEGTVPA